MERRNWLAWPRDGGSRGHGRIPVRTRALRRAAMLALFWAGLLAACSTVPPGPEHSIRTHALAHPETTRLGRLIGPELDAHPGLSGFELVVSGREAYSARYALILNARKTLDLQYYIWENDVSGRRLLAALLAAAERGARVRLLLDDLNIEDRDRQLALIAAHPNIEVRLFNPFDTGLGHLTDFLFHAARVNHRMHNKAFIADNAMAIVGGRNIGDAYFSANAAGDNFRDLDLFAVGPIVRDISRNFDEFWNSPWATSVEPAKLGGVRPSPWDRLRRKLLQPVPPTPAFPFEPDVAPAAAQELLDRLPSRLLWGEAMLLADDPNKAKTSESKIAEGLKAHIGDSLSRDLMIESAYFIPAGGGAEHYCDLAARGVRVRILTNSLASTDEIIAFGAYTKYRRELLGCGVGLYELRADADFIRREWKWLKGHSQAQLHSKAMVFDREEVLIGSYNLDPRSRYLNTEMALLIDSPALAAKLADVIEDDMRPDNSWTLRLGGDGKLFWIGENDGRRVVSDHEPDTTLSQRIGTKLFSLIPIDSLL